MDSLDERLQDQVAFLDTSCEAYDRGAIREAYRLATTIRVLVHDTPKSHSLLFQMGEKGRIGFVDGRLPSFSALGPEGEGMVTSATSLTMIAHFSQREGNSRDASEYWPAYRTEDGWLTGKPRVEFDRWWKAPISTDTRGNSLFRRHFILAAANKEGGAHIDPNFGGDLQAYWAMTREGSMGTVSRGTYVEVGEPPGSGGDDLSPALAIIRHIAEEVRVGLRDQLAEHLGALAAMPPDVEIERPFMLSGDMQWNLQPGFTIGVGPQYD